MGRKLKQFHARLDKLAYQLHHKLGHSVSDPSSIQTRAKKLNLLAGELSDVEELLTSSKPPEGFPFQLSQFMEAANSEVRVVLGCLERYQKELATIKKSVALVFKWLDEINQGHLFQFSTTLKLSKLRQKLGQLQKKKVELAALEKSIETQLIKLDIDPSELEKFDDSIPMYLRHQFEVMGTKASRVFSMHHQIQSEKRKIEQMESWLIEHSNPPSHSTTSSSYTRGGRNV